MIGVATHLSIAPSIVAEVATGRPPAVLQVLPSLVQGGVERGTVEIATALAAAGWRSLVASSGGPLARELARHGTEHIQLPLASKNPFVIRRNGRRLAELIAARQVDIVHARSRAPAWSALAAARKSGAHFVTTFHSSYGEAAWKHWYNAVMAKGERVIAISDFLAEHARRRFGVEEPRLVTIHRGVDLALFDPRRVNGARIVDLARAWRLEDGARVLLLPGRLTRWKGQVVMLRAFAALAREDVQCVLLGSAQGRDKYRRELEDLATALGIAQRVRIVEQGRDMPAAYMLADVVVSASIEPEGFGRVAAEAQAMGRPVVATNHGGSRETVLPGETGWLVPPGDVGALAQALAAAIDLGEVPRRAIAERARQHITEKFSLDAMRQRTLQVYYDLLFPA